MSKITRRTYKRKKIVMGLALFGAIGLVSTGFAAWVLSASASNTQNPNIKVGTVSDKSMEFDNVKIYGIDKNPTHDVPDGTFNTEIEIDKYSFNPRWDDNSGRVRFGGNDGADEGERLSLIVRGTIKEAQNLGRLTVSFDKDGDGNLPTRLVQAVDAGYIVLPECANAVKDIPFTPLSGAGSQTLDFECEIAFEWGAAFGGVNPGDYYDQASGDGHDATITQVKNTLDDMHELLDTVSFGVTFEAIPN